MNKLLALFFIHILFIPFFAMAKEAVGTVDYIRGKAYANDKLIELNQKVFINDMIKTLEKSVVKIKLFDNSTITVAPESTINIDNVDKGENASLISVLKGGLRAVVPKKVTKEMKDKLILRSPAAAFGVRGTDFLIGHNKSEKNSHIITFTGKVKVAAFTKSTRNFKEISRYLDSNGITVSKGQFSSLNPDTDSFSQPTKINPLQLNLLKRNNLFLKKQSKKQATRVGSIYPKTLPKDLRNDAKETKMALTKNEGPLPGGIVDLKTGKYIEPDPENSNYDTVQGVFVPKDTVKMIDSLTGEMKQVIQDKIVEQLPQNQNRSGLTNEEIKDQITQQRTTQQTSADSSTSNPQPEQFSTPPSPPVNNPAQQQNPVGSDLFQNQQQTNNQEVVIPPSTRIRLIPRGDD